MSLAEKISQLVPHELPPDNLAEVREDWERGMTVVACVEDPFGQGKTSRPTGWRTRVVLRDELGDYHCHRYSCWVYGSRWDVFRDYIGKDSETVMKWLCGVDPTQKFDGN